MRSRLDQKAPFTIRFAFDGAVPAWEDFVYGTIASNRKPGSFQHSHALSDTILVKSDGTPTYHFANVVDDHEMEITHVIRGTEWMPSTALHVALYDAFGWKPPKFGHVGLLTDENHNKLSKRNFDTDVRTLKDKHGLLPSALNNFLLLLGWRNPTTKDTQTMEGMIKLFDLKFSKGDSVVSLDKLWFLQRRHATRILTAVAKDGTCTEELDTLLDYLVRGEVVRAMPQDLASRVLKGRNVKAYLTCILCSDPGNYESPQQYLGRNGFYFDLTDRAEPMSKNDDSAMVRIVQEFMDHGQVQSALDLWDDTYDASAQALCKTLDAASDICGAVLADLMVKSITDRPDRSTADQDEEIPDVKKTKEYREVAASVYHMLRARLTFSEEPGPSSMRVMAVLGYEESRRRIFGSSRPGP